MSIALKLGIPMEHLSEQIQPAGLTSDTPAAFPGFALPMTDGLLAEPSIAAQTAWSRIWWALNAQNYRQVNLSALRAPGTIDLSNVPDDLVRAHQGMMRELTNWSRIGEQLALLRARINEHDDFLWAVFIRAKSQAFQVVTVCGYFGIPLPDSFFKRHFDYSWVIMQSLEDHIQQFNIDENLLKFLETIWQKYLSFTNPVIKAIVDLAWSFISSAKASGGPQAAFLSACFGGLDGSLQAKLRNSGYNPGQSGWGTQPAQDGLAWDCRRAEFDENDLYFSVVNTIDMKRFKQSLR
jgi:hypothetical protein